MTTVTSDPLLSPRTNFTTHGDLCVPRLPTRPRVPRAVAFCSQQGRTCQIPLSPHATAPPSRLPCFSVLSLFKLRRYHNVSQELHVLTFDDELGIESPRFRYQSYPEIYLGRSGSMLPLATRYIHALSPQRLGDRKETLDRLYTLLDHVRKKVASLESKDSQWSRREKIVMSAICCNHFCHKEYGICLLLIQELVQKEQLDPVLLSQIGYVQMQMGDLERCNATFARIEAMPKDGGDNDDIRFENLLRRNKALGFVLAKEYASAVREYEECMEKDPADVVAINNKALCLRFV